MRIVIRPFLTLPGNGNDLTSARLVLEVIEADGVSSAIFVHERYTITKETGPVQENRFIAVAKPGDLEVYPVGSPSEMPGALPYYRLNCVDVSFNSPAILDEHFRGIISEVNGLLEALKRLDGLEQQDDIIIEV